MQIHDKSSSPLYCFPFLFSVSIKAQGDTCPLQPPLAVSQMKDTMTGFQHWPENNNKGNQNPSPSKWLPGSFNKYLLNAYSVPGIVPGTAGIYQWTKNASWHLNFRREGDLGRDDRGPTGALGASAILPSPNGLWAWFI